MQAYTPAPYTPVDETPETADRPGDAFEIAEAQKECPGEQDKADQE